MSRIYIAGPMRGYPEHNIPTFRAAAQMLRGAGFHVVSPVEVGEAWAGPDQDAHPAEEWVRRDLFELLTCDSIALLPGWEASTGARCEAAVAVTLGFTFFDLFPNTDQRWATRDAPAFIAIAGGYNRAPGVVDSLDRIAADSCEWANRTFGAANPHSKTKHLLEEAGELHAAPHDDEEAADVFLLLAHLMHGRDLVGAARRKLEQNKLRAWGQPDDDGVVRHLKVAS